DDGRDDAFDECPCEQPDWKRRGVAYKWTAGHPAYSRSTGGGRGGRPVVFSIPGSIDKLDSGVRSHARDESVAPHLKRRTAVRSSRVFVNFIRRAGRDINPAAIGPPACNARARSEMVVGVCDAAVVLLLHFVLRGSGRRVAAQPELLDEH